MRLPMLGVRCGLALLLACAASVAGAQTAGKIFVTPIPGAAFSGTVRVERSDLQPNGGTLQTWTEWMIARDVNGRIRNEQRPLLPMNVKAAPELIMVHLYDPRNRMTEYLYPQQKTYWMMILNRPPATDTKENFASPTAVSAPPSELTRQEDLGFRTIAGLETHGVRVTQTLSADQSGTGHEVVVTNEYWYSDALRLNLMTRHNDPRTGIVMMTVTNIDRREPDATLFGVPGDYVMAAPAPAR